MQGYITPEDGGKVVFVHWSKIEMEGFRYLLPGMPVEYTEEINEKVGVLFGLFAPCHNTGLAFHNRALLRTT